MAGSFYEIVSVVLAGAVFMAMLSIVYMSWRNGISPMPSSAQACRSVAAELNRISKRGTIVEAGSGWGTLALYIVRHCGVGQLVGVENSPVPLWISRFLSASSPVSRGRISFIRGDIYAYPYEGVDAVVCYLYPGAMKRLSMILGERLTPGATIISVCFALPGWRPERVITCGDLYRTKVYVYAVGQKEETGCSRT